MQKSKEALVTTDWSPEQNFVMLSPLLLSEVSDGGILIPGVAYRKTGRGVVIKVGPQVDEKRFQIGKTECFFPQNTEYDVVVNDSLDTHIYLLRDSDVIMTRPFSS